MTEKQENILLTALELFATQGYHAVSTSKIAKQAGVSEALIFRHFENKEGLLDAIKCVAEEKMKTIMADIVMSSDPKEVLRKAIIMPFGIDKKEYKMWRLTYALKWQMGNYNPKKMEPLKMALTNAFEKLGYEDPKSETELITMFLDGAATAILLHEPDNKKDIMTSLLNKYDL
ncbi:MAG: helix-turn-helix domain-containing protein [Flavipsychrobacter sp.]